MFTKILVPLDGSDLAEQVLPHALMLADVCNASVRLLRVVEGPDDIDLTSVSQEESAHIRLAEDYLQGAVEYCAVLGVSVDSGIAMGSPAKQIVREAQTIGADLIAMATHVRRGIERWLHGSVAGDVLNSTHLPVLLVTPISGIGTRTWGLAQRYRRILVPLDGSDRAQAILAHAAPLARCLAAELVLVSVARPGASAEHRPDVLHRYLERVRDSLAAEGTRASIVVEEGPVVETILAVAQDAHADLLALTTRGLGGLHAVLGGTCVRLLEGTTRPVLAVRPQA
jgi:nucleotide-binding universal stress UspA family protein